MQYINTSSLKGLDATIEHRAACTLQEKKKKRNKTTKTKPYQTTTTKTYSRKAKEINTHMVQYFTDICTCL